MSLPLEWRPSPPLGPNRLPAPHSFPQVQRAAAGALRTLAFKNEDNKNKIVECGALPHLVYMVRDADTNVHYEAVGVLGNLVHSSPAIKKKVLEEGALQPVIGLLSSQCTESQREAALLLGQFATTVDEQRASPDYKARPDPRFNLHPPPQRTRCQSYSCSSRA